MKENYLNDVLDAINASIQKVCMEMKDRNEPASNTQKIVRDVQSAVASGLEPMKKRASFLSIPAQLRLREIIDRQPLPCELGALRGEIRELFKQSEWDFIYSFAYTGALAVMSKRVVKWSSPTHWNIIAKAIRVEVFKEMTFKFKGACLLRGHQITEVKRQVTDWDKPSEQRLQRISDIIANLCISDAISAWRDPADN